MSRIPGVNAVVVLLLSALLLTGCVKFYRTSEVNNSFNDGERKLNEITTLIETFQNEQQAGYDYLSPQVGSTKEPYPEMLSSLQKINVVVERLKSHQAAFALLKKSLDSLVATLPVGQNIRSDKPGWEEFKPIYEKFMALAEDLNECIEQVNDAQNDLRELENDHNIVKVSAAEMKNQITAVVNALEQNMPAAREKLSSADREAVEQKQNEIKQFSDEINTELAGKTEVWVAPGSLVNVKYDAIKKKAEEAYVILGKIK